MHGFKKVSLVCCCCHKGIKIGNKELYKAYKHAYLLGARFVANGDMSTVHSKS